LIVTYTNHALHQFLHHIKDFTQKIIKIGGKRDEELDQFDLRQRMREEKAYNGMGGIFRTLGEIEG
jgi:hypothetical protein